MEIAVIAVIALIVLGPSKLPEAARSLGKGFREMRDSFSGAMNDDEDDKGDKGDEDESENPEGDEDEDYMPEAFADDDRTRRPPRTRPPPSRPRTTRPWSWRPARRPRRA
ncbi:MAG: twin-arginine translocase TatA/TatE family subunit [Thermoleophilaceae bacterium]